MEIPSGVIDLLNRALEEDIGPGDITSHLLIPGDDESKAVFLAKENFILAGIPFVREVFRLIDPSLSFHVFFDEGSQVRKGEIIAEVSGNSQAILRGERVSLNILQRLSGIATITGMFVKKIKGTEAKIVDTRKTTPCLRFMEKYAVRMGGGSNHRFGLFDGILIKDNHIEAAGTIMEAVKRAKTGLHLLKIEIEVENMNEFAEAIEAGADIIMLDNMAVNDMKEAVQIAQGNIILEASGGITIDNVREIAETGVDLISIGALTHSAKAVDISLKIVR